MSGDGPARSHRKMERAACYVASEVGGALAPLELVEI
jgi:hypothetical protein